MQYVICTLMSFAALALYISNRQCRGHGIIKERFPFVCQQCVKINMDAL